MRIKTPGAKLDGSGLGLFGVGLAVAAAVLGIIGIGQLRVVKPNRPGKPCVEPQVVCFENVNGRDARESLALLTLHDVPMRLGLPSECLNGTNTVDVIWDPNLNSRSTSSNPESVLHELAEVRWSEGPFKGCVTSAVVSVLYSEGKIAITHGLLHAAGFEHPDNAPSGTILHPTRPSLRDWRGVDAEK